MKDYELLEHTADIRVRVWGDDQEALFRHAANAMFDILALRRKDDSRDAATLKVALKAENVDELFVNWLNELLSLSATKELIFIDFDIKQIGENIIEAVVRGESAKRYEMKVEIKAATYHELQLTRTGRGWQAEVIFDV